MHKTLQQINRTDLNDLFDWLPPRDMSEEAEARRAQMWKSRDIAFAVRLLADRDCCAGLIEELPLNCGDECPF